ncbi:Lipase 4 [Paramyrothecium foliicola]|nr:Lipase 4 [Paramyrothecium foliicola]
MPYSRFLWFAGLIAAVASLPLQDAPLVELRNGSYVGVWNPSQGLDHFLSIPYAQPPLKELRFRPPQPLSTAWSGVRNATSLQAECYQYGDNGLTGGSEDCLTINVVRPAGSSPNAALPVAFWIHGGGLVGGSNSNPAYDLSNFVNESVRIGKPVIAVGINYRLHAWGFLWGSAVAAENAGNLGFRDQRLALQWVQENVAAFGGDPQKVTIWGQSGGARGVASQLTAFGGRDDGLFRAAIMQSATGFHTNFGEVDNNSTTWDQALDSVLKSVECESGSSSLDCLRQVPAQDLAEAFGATKFPSFLDIVDGDFIQAHRSELIRTGQFVHVPVINGITTDDGDYFAKKPINTDAEWEQWLREGGASNDTINILSTLYPDDPAVGLPATFQGRPTGKLLEEYGSQWKRAVAFGGDRAMQAPRRAWVKSWAAAGIPAYSYRFDVVTGDRPAVQGVGHSAEMPFVLRNFQRLPQNPPEEFYQLSANIAAKWIRFIRDLDPNGGSCVQWPPYEVDDGKNLVFSIANMSLSYREQDTFRAEQFAFLDSKLWQIGLESK